MELAKERQKELEPLAVRVYQQISVGHPMPRILNQFDSQDFEREEVDWIIKNGKDRYFGYQSHILKMNRDTARSFIMAGFGLLGIWFLLDSFIGSPTAGRHVGMMNLAWFGGIGSMLYGGYSWVTAETNDTRTDLD